MKLIPIVRPPVQPTIGYCEKQRKKSQAYLVKNNILQFTAQVCGQFLAHMKTTSRFVYKMHTQHLSSNTFQALHHNQTEVNTAFSHGTLF